MTAVTPRTSPLVAIFNSRDEVIEAIRSALENDGFETVTARLAEIQNGTLDLVAFIKVHGPDVIVYDLPRPYENHWNFLRLMKETTSLKDRTWILTTTDKEAVEAAVGTAEEALEVLQRERPNVLLSDLSMPGKGGYWLIGQVRALPPERGGTTPAAALTAYTGPEHRASVLRAGFQYHVAKPVSMQELIGVVAILALKV